MSEKTIALSGAETEVHFSGGNAWLRNDGASAVYAAKTAGVTAGADGVVSIPAGGSAPVYGANGTVFLLGSGSVQLVGSDYATNPFKTSTSSGGSAVDETARTAIETHTENAVVHVTAEEKAAWNAVNYINPNLLDNPNFRINQRGFVSGSTGTGGFCIDRWLIGTGETFTLNDDGSATIKCVASAGRNFQQSIEIPTYLIGKTVTLSSEFIEVSGSVKFGYTDSTGQHTPYITNTGVVSLTFEIASSPLTINLVPTAIDGYVTVNYVKLELGSFATAFCPPDYATELAKCQRFYQIRSTGDIDPVDLRPGMATIKDIKQREDGNYEYIAEL